LRHACKSCGGVGFGIHLWR
ncbi:unnamed protein product, partial [Rotaria magnacalcarata]